jgi:hypothetical protein
MRLSGINAVMQGGDSSPSVLRRGAGFSPWSGPWQMFSVLALCLAVRLLTTIHYIEDPDSLRFALAMRDFDVPRLQPHFPGYPVFCFAAKLLYALTGRFSAAFSLLGGLGLFAMVHVSLSLLRRRAATLGGVIVITLLAADPMIWLLGNRYMPDLSGGALALLAFWLLVDDANPRPQKRAAGFLIAGLLAGWRLSYLPFLIVPLAWSLWRAQGNARRAVLGAIGVAGILVWLIPLVAVTGWDDLWAAAARHTAGHFNEFGGTYRTEPGFAHRIAALLEALWTDGLGAWSPGRNPVTIPVALGALLFGSLGARRALTAWRAQSPERAPLTLLAASCVVYAAWILLFQNIVHQSRHVLPLVPPLLILIAGGMRGKGLLRRGAATFFLVVFAWTGTVLALQHRHPTALAQAKAWIEAQAGPDVVVVCPPMVRDHLLLQGVRVRIVEADAPEDLPLIDSAFGFARVLTVGDYSSRVRLPLAEKRAFHHNPHVNRLWPTVEVFRYERERRNAP